MRLGSIYAAQIEFTDGSIAGLAVERAGRRVALTEAFSPPLRAEPPDPPSVRIESVGESFLAPLRETVRTRQRLGAGSRDLAIFADIATRALDSDRSARLATKLSFTFTLPEPTQWTLDFGVAFGLEQTAAETIVKLAGVSISIAAGTSTIAAQQTSVAIALGAGASSIEMTVTVDGWSDVSDTVVICRPEQLHEAAIALAALPDTRFVPLVILEPPPTGLDALRPVVRDYLKSVAEANSSFGGLAAGEFARKTRDEWLAFAQDFQDRRQRLEQLLPYRSWAKRNSILQGLLSEIGAKRAICLCDPSPEELAIEDVVHALSTAPSAEHDPASRPNLLSGIERVLIDSALAPTGPDPVARLQRIYEDCRQRLGNVGAPLEAEMDDPASVILGLSAARRAGRPLRLVKGDGRRKAPVRADPPARAESRNHVVAVEARPRAEALISALFAVHAGAPLIAIPEPDVTETDAAIEAMQQAVVEWAGSPGRSLSDAAPDAQRLFSLSDAVAVARKYLYGDRRPELLLALERAVARQVPAEFIDFVGDAALTVFGTGLPYSFVADGRKTWADKSIGHVISDGDLIVLSEIVGEGVIAPVQTFNLVVDPGFFARSETDVVADLLSRGSARSLILKSDAQIGNIFLAIVGRLPLQLAFFNTHGSDDAILLGRYPLPRSLIPQWLEFRGINPLVFNNSCQSWTGVGREFVRVGARGYVGTLWSVAANTAAELAEAAVERMVGQAMPISAAIHPPDLDPFTARAYIYVGTANAAFRLQDRLAQIDDVVLLVAAMQWQLRLLEAVRPVIHAGEPDAFSRQLRDDFRVLRAALAERAGEGMAELAIDAIIEELDLVESKDDAIAESRDARDKLVRQAMALIASLPDDAARARREAKCLRAHAHVLTETGAFAEAMDAARKAAALDQKWGRSDWASRVTIIQIAIDSGDISAALRLAEEAYALADEKKATLQAPGEPAWHELAILGRLCQVMKRIPDKYDRGIQLATRGVELAHAEENLLEEATFEADLSQLHLLAGNAQAALEAGVRALALARRSARGVSELGAYGMIGQAYIALGNAEQARFHAEAGLKRAQDLDEPQRQIAFLSDLGRIEMLDGKPDAAVARWCELLDLAAQTSRPEMWQAAAGNAAIALAPTGHAAAGAALILGAAGSLSKSASKNIGLLAGELISLFLGLGVGWTSAQRIALHEGVMGGAEAVLGKFSHDRALGGLVGAVFLLSPILLMLEQGETAAAIESATALDQHLGTGGQIVDVLKQIVAKGQ